MATHISSSNAKKRRTKLEKFNIDKYIAKLPERIAQSKKNPISKDVQRADGSKCSETDKIADQITDYYIRYCWGVD
jgi:hypothetical protein